MTIELLGDNCHKCCLMERNIRLALHGSGIDAKLQCVDDLERIVDYGLLSLPGFAVDGRLRAEGQLLSIKKILKILAS